MLVPFNACACFDLGSNYTCKLFARHTQVEALAFNADDSQCAICCSNKIVVVPVRSSSTSAPRYHSQDAMARLHVVAPRSRVASSATSSASALDSKRILQDDVVGDEAGWRAISFFDSQVRKQWAE